MTYLTTFPCALIAVKTVLSFGLLFGNHAFAQSPAIDQLTLARQAIAKQDWRTAETLLVSLSQKESLTQNPFVFYELAQVYENTRRPDAAKKIYLELTTSLDLAQRQPTIVVRAPYASRLLSLVSLSQTKLNAIEARQSAALPPPEPVPAAAISVALKNWADAWARKDLPKYYASYTDNYRGEFSTSDAWRRNRQINISKAETIQLDIKNIAMVTLSPALVQVEFMQVYAFDLTKETSNKILTFVSRNGQWLIESETLK